MTLSLVSENSRVGVLNNVETVKIIATLGDDLVNVILDTSIWGMGIECSVFKRCVLFCCHDGGGRFAMVILLA